MERQTYIFRNNKGQEIATWYDCTAEQMTYVAMGMANGMHLYRRHVEIKVYAVDDKGQETLIRVQQ